MRQGHDDIRGTSFEDLECLPGEYDFLLRSNTPKGIVKVEVVCGGLIGCLCARGYAYKMGIVGLIMVINVVTSLPICVPKVFMHGRWNAILYT